MRKIISWLHHFFVPSGRNSYRAKALHTDALGAYLLVAISFGILWRVLPLSQIGDMVLGIATDINNAKLLECTNQKRAEHGLPPVSPSPQLESAAHAKAQDMISRDYWNHFGPGGTTPWQFILRAGYQYEYAGENLAKNFLFSPDVCEAWMNSPTHRENMLRQAYSNVGFAVLNGVLQGEETTLVVQMFATPANAAPSENTASTPVQLATTESVPTAIPTPETQPSASPMPNPTGIELAGVTSLTTSVPSAVLAESDTLAGRVGAHLLQYKASFAFLLIIFMALISDLYWAHHLGVLRVTGKHLAHLVFVISILAGLLILSKGTISTQAAFL